MQSKYKILETNFRIRTGEIDIIAQKDDTVVFVEVKSRKNLNYGMPMEAVNQRKMKKIINVAQFYITYKIKADMQYRFDVIEVFLKDKEKINHIEDAFCL